MADNTQMNAGAGGDVLKSDDIGAYKIAAAKLVTGGDGVDGNYVTATNPIHVAPGTSTTWPISANALPLPAGAATEASLGTDGSSPPAIAGTGIRGWLRGIYEKLAGTLAVSGAVSVSNFPGTQAISGNIGTVTTLTTCATVTNLAQLGGTAIAMGTGVRSAGTQRITIATDDVIPVRNQDGTGNALTSIVAGSQRALTIAIVDASGNQVTAFGGSGGTSSNFGAAAPTAGTAAGFSDGTNMQLGRVFDADSGAGTQYVQGAILRKSASGGSVEVGTATDPIRTDPTGTTTQPVSIAANVVVVGAGAAGGTLTGNPVLVAGSDGLNARTIATDASGNVEIVGSVAHASTDGGNPIKVGGKASNTTPSSVTTGQRVDAWYTLAGAEVSAILHASNTFSSDGSGAPGHFLISNNGSGLAAVGTGYCNGSSWDRVRNNVDVTLHSSAARTATINSSDQVNYNGSRVLLIYNVTATGGGSISPSIQFKDSVSGSYQTIWTAGTPLTATGTYVYQLALGSAGGSFAEHVPCGLLARTWRLATVAGNASSITYSASGITNAS